MQTILAPCRPIDSITADAAESYAAAARLMAEHVSSALARNPEISKLIGNNPLEVMRNKHRDHASFMTTVLRLKAFELLIRNLSWADRVYRARGFSDAYYPCELTAWKQALKQHLPASHAAEILPVYDWMRQNHAAIVLLPQREDRLTAAQAEAADRQHSFLSLLLQGDYRGCLGLAEEWVRTSAELQSFYLRILCPVMHRIGELWERNEISVAEEHLATAIAGRVMASLYPRFVGAGVCRGTALVTAAPNEHHELGARMVADFLEMEGWGVTFLGANTPAADVLAFLKRHPPFVLAVSVASVFNLDKAARVLAAIRSDPETRHLKIIVGGFVFKDLPQLWRDLGADGYAPDAREAAVTVNRWWGGRCDPS